MEPDSLLDTLYDQTRRALWEVGHVLACLPDDLWDKPYGGAPLHRHVYHMLHSLDRWFINPRDPAFREPPFHQPDLNDLDTPLDTALSRRQLMDYFDGLRAKTLGYLKGMRQQDLLEKPPGCEYTRFTLIVAQHRHLHTHMGMLMGFLVADREIWPEVLGLEGAFPPGG